jgi:hypothetical protein
MVVNQCLVDRMRSAGRGLVNFASYETLAMGDAREQIRENICRPLERLVGGGVKAEMISKEGACDFFIPACVIPCPDFCT